MNFFIEKNLRLYLETGNPLYAWKCIEHATIFKCPIPGEVVEYLRDAAHGIIKVAQNPPKPPHRPTAIAKALKLHKDGAGQGSPFTDYSTRRKDREIALDTAESIREWGGDKKDYAFEAIAGKYSLSKSTVRRNFLSHSRRWRLMAEKFIANEDVTFDADGNPTRRVCGTAEDLREFAEILEEVSRIEKQK